LSGALLDTGALIAFERNDRRVVAIVKRAIDLGERLVVPAGVVAQAWRDGRRQVRLARLLGARELRVEALDDTAARATGQLLGATGTADVVDASAALLAQRQDLSVVTSDPGAFPGLDPTLRVTVV
jgi:predicted nucleic acid-binding protein